MRTLRVGDSKKDAQRIPKGILDEYGKNNKKTIKNTNEYKKEYSKER